ncbi:MAG: hypothetical protein QG553_930 [Patescibacteria group bacterium]|nr:hypothetical protein [Patescibacteria group bacterium]
MKMKPLYMVAAVLGCLVLLAISQYLFITFNGTNVPAPNIPRQPLTKGSGDNLNYLVLGDSSAISQGSDYSQGVAVGTTDHLAQKYKVTMTNLAVSGARTKDVLQSQLPQFEGSPDIVLLLIGSNDVTHFTSKASIEKSLRAIISEIKYKNCKVKIVVTGSAQMGAVPRLPQPARWLVGARTTSVNKLFKQVSDQEKLTFAALAEKTGDTFRGNLKLFAPDKFHANGEGYAVWTPVFNDSIDEALTNQPAHCAQD